MTANGCAQALEITYLFLISHYPISVCNLIYSIKTILTPQLGSPRPIFKDIPAEGIVVASLGRNSRFISHPECRVEMIQGKMLGCVSCLSGMGLASFGHDTFTLRRQSNFDVVPS